MNGPNQESVDDAVRLHLTGLTKSMGRAANIDIVKMLEGLLIKLTKVCQ
jgi:hypothetical protein